MRAYRTKRGGIVEVETFMRKGAPIEAKMVRASAEAVAVRSDRVKPEPC